MGISDAMATCGGRVESGEAVALGFYRVAV
jgi:hypothetical protein